MQQISIFEALPTGNVMDLVKYVQSKNVPVHQKTTQTYWTIQEAFSI